jgi:hypothetical protein
MDVGAASCPSLNHSTKAINMRYSITKEDLLRRVLDSLLYDNKPIAAPYDMLEFSFGFVRKSGEEIMYTQLMFPGRTEMQICMSPRYKIIENINNWCKEYGFIGHFDEFKDMYFFTGILPKH